MRINKNALILMAIGSLFSFAPVYFKHHPKEAILIATQKLVDKPFGKTLILIAGNAMFGWNGVILNKPLTPEQQAQLPEFVRDKGIVVGYGGPVNFPEQIMVVESQAQFQQGDKMFTISGWDAALARTPDLLEKIRESQDRHEQRYRVFAGYAGWMSLQLENEIFRSESWHQITPKPEIFWQGDAKVGWDALEDEERTRLKRLRMRKA